MLKTLNRVNRTFGSGRRTHFSGSIVAVFAIMAALMFWGGG